MSADTTFYEVIQDGIVEGRHVLVRRSGGEFESRFAWKHNGHGPELVERFTLAVDGTYERYAVTGLSEWETPVDEAFARRGGTDTWHSASGSEEATSEPGTLYWPVSGTPARYAVAVRALSLSPSASLELLPDGSMGLEMLLSHDLRDTPLELLGLTGLGFAPVHVWVTAGQDPEVVALLDPGGIQIVRAGWRDAADELMELQEAAARNRRASLEARIGVPLPGVTLIRGARVFDSEHGVLRPHREDVYLGDGRILAVVPADSLFTDAQHVIDADGRALLPGLFDMHVHFDADDGPLHLAAGVTTVRDMGNDNAALRRIITEAEAGRLMAPHLLAAGFIDGESPFSLRHGFVIDDLEEALEAVEWYASNGYAQVKLYNSFPPELVRPLADHAHARGLRVSGHIPAFLRAEQAVERGYDEIQHIIFVVLNFLQGPETDTRTLERFYLPARETAALDLESPQVRAFIDLLVSKGVAVDPNLATFSFLYHRAGELLPTLAAVADHLPTDVRRSLRSSDMDIPDDATAALHERSFARMIELVGVLHRSGVQILAGSDWTAGFTLQRELELYVEAGLTPGEALRIATWEAARYTALLDDRGSVEPGKRADLVLLDGDPTAEIAAIRRVVLVLKDGRAYSPAEIYGTLGVRPFSPSVVIGTP